MADRDDSEALDLFAPSDAESADAPPPAVAPRSGSMGGDSSDNSLQDLDRPPRARRGGRRRMGGLLSGLILLLVCSPGVLWMRAGDPLPSVDNPMGRFCWGLILCEWKLTDEHGLSDSQDTFVQRAAAHTRHVPRYGSVLWDVVNSLRVDVDGGFDLGPRALVPSQILPMLEKVPAIRRDGQRGLFGDMLEGFVALAPPDSLIKLASFGEGLAKDVITATAQCAFHAVSITRKVGWARMLAGPSMRDIQEFRTGAEVVAGGAARRLNVRRANHVAGTHPVDLIIDWLVATRHLLDSQQAEIAAHDFARVYTRSAVERARLRANVIKVNRETLRKARVRLDAASMLAMQSLWSIMDLDAVNCYLFTDGSPQWRGWELYASTMDVIFADYDQRHLLPMVSLPRNMLHRAGIFGQGK